MLTSINITPSGNYQVSVYLRDENGYGRWHDLREFAYQGHARDFANMDCPKFTDVQIKDFARTYQPGKAYFRYGFRNYRSCVTPTLQEILDNCTNKPSWI